MIFAYFLNNNQLSRMEVQDNEIPSECLWVHVSGCTAKDKRFLQERYGIDVTQFSEQQGNDYMYGLSAVGSVAAINVRVLSDNICYPVTFIYSKKILITCSSEKGCSFGKMVYFEKDFYGDSLPLSILKIIVRSITQALLKITGDMIAKTGMSHLHDNLVTEAFLVQDCASSFRRLVAFIGRHTPETESISMNSLVEEFNLIRDQVDLFLKKIKIISIKEQEKTVALLFKEIKKIPVLLLFIAFIGFLLLIR